MDRSRCPIHPAHTTLADFLKNFVMADGRADHRMLPHAMQLRTMLRLEGVKGNGNPPARSAFPEGVQGEGAGLLFCSLECYRSYP